MGVVRGKIFHDVELVTLVRTDGDWPFYERDGKWIHRDTGEEYEPITLREALIREGIDPDTLASKAKADE